MMIGCTCNTTGSEHFFPCPYAASPTVQPAPTVGWICPNCRAGVAPSVQRCPCMLPTFTVTGRGIMPSIVPTSPSIVPTTLPDVLCENPQ